MFADTDFILALVKDTDWLKENAVNILKENKGKIRTSVSVMIEMALMCKKFKVNTMNTFAHIFEIIDVDGETYSVCMRAALYIEKYNLNVFDAFHASFCGEDKIISSDDVYESVGIYRIRLEK
ncbi:PIN domain-containing protein [Candidatus Woesearchaeota archaeon]|nr:PIN domain-containing protein [Candidatus Woesearchaeota archaeon]